MTEAPARLQAHEVTLRYSPAQAPAVDGVSLALPEGRITAIVGPNGCGKSTLLRALARLMTPTRGTVTLDGKAIQRQPTKAVAQRLGLLPQQPVAPPAVTVADLAARGRYPHTGVFAPPGERDRHAVERALARTGMDALRARSLDTLSGGQRQRAWIAMALAQEPAILLLDEPTTYLDVAYQQEVLALLQRLNREDGRTIGVVLHDVNNAAAVADHIVALRAGRIVAQGSPDKVVTGGPLETIFGVGCDVIGHPRTGRPTAMPRGSAAPPQPAAARSAGPALAAEGLVAGYGREPVLDGVTLRVPAGQVTAIVGPNACGKSTLLRSFARLLAPTAGVAWIHGRPVAQGPRRDLARSLAVLLQGARAPAGFRVEDLVAAGRYPHQRWYRQWRREDRDAVARALHATGMTELRWRPLETLSGGQRQRAWLALTLAQDSDVLVLDEPTTFLDLAHQAEILELVRDLNRTEGRTVVLVLHDLGQACRYGDRLVAMAAGRVAATGPPRSIVTERLVRDIFGVAGTVVSDPVTGGPLVLPDGPQPPSQTVAEERHATPHAG